MLLGDKIRLLLKEKGYSQQMLADRLGITVQGMRKILNTNSTTHKRIIEIAALLGTTASYLMNDLETKSVVAEPEPSYKTTLEKTVPVYDIQAQASNVDSFDDELADAPKSHVKVPGFEDCTLAVYVWNHSMYPTYENGCMVIVKEIKDKSFIQYGSVYLVITNEQRVVKRIYEDDDDPEMLLMASDNPELRKDQKPKYPTYKMRKSLIKRLFLVKETIKRTEI